jgi:hypothetical protein
MIENTTLPQNLITAVGSENKDFAVKADRNQPFKKSFTSIFFGTVWTVFTGFCIFIMFGPLFRGKEVHFKTNGVPTVASINNLEPLLMPAIFIGIFLLIGIGILSSGVYSVFKKGGYFVGTPTRLVCYQKGNIRSIDWEQFTGNIEVDGNAQRGNISLQLRTGSMVNGRRSSRYVPDVIYITGVPSAFEIEQTCRKRIKENDPTPTATGRDMA